MGLRPLPWEFRLPVAPVLCVSCDALPLRKLNMEGALFIGESVGAGACPPELLGLSVV